MKLNFLKLFFLLCSFYSHFCFADWPEPKYFMGILEEDILEKITLADPVSGEIWYALALKAWSQHEPGDPRIVPEIPKSFKNLVKFKRAIENFNGSQSETLLILNAVRLRYNECLSSDSTNIRHEIIDILKTKLQK